MHKLRHSPQRAIAWLVPLALVIIFSVGCTYTPFPELRGTALSPSQNVELEELLRSRAAQIPALKMLTKTRMSVRGETIAVRHVFLIEKPGKIRIDTLPLSGSLPLHFLICRDGKVMSVDPERKQVVVGNDDGRLMASQIGIRAECLELVHLLTASVSPDTFLGAAEGGWNSVLSDAGDSYAALNEKRGVYFKVERESGMLRELQQRSIFDDELLISLKLLSSQEDRGIALPEEMLLSLPDVGVELEFKVRAISLEESLEDKRFRFDIPADFSVQQKRSGS